MKSFVFKGTLKSSDDKSQQVIDINMTHNGLSIRGLTKNILETDKTLIPDDNGVYVLESEDVCYVGQSKNLRDRLKNHFANNKINHSRIFFLYKKEDIRGYLDYMEKKLFKSMCDEGYDLANGTNLDPDLDRLDIEEKRTVDIWINEFLVFLPILGFRKEVSSKKVSNEPLKVNQESTKVIDEPNFNNINSQDIIPKNVNVENNNLTDRALIRYYIEQIPYEELVNSKAINDSLDVRNTPFINKYTKNNCLQLTNKYGEQIYFIMNMNKSTLQRKIGILSELYEKCESSVKEIKKIDTVLTRDLKPAPLREKLYNLLKDMSFKEISNTEKLISTAVDIRLEPFNKRYKPFTPAREIINKYGEIMYIALNIDSKMLEKKIAILEKTKK